MEKILLPQKALHYTRKIAPAKVHEKFECVPCCETEIYNEKKFENNASCKTKKPNVKKLFISFILVLLMIFSGFILTMSQTEIGIEVRSVVEKIFEPRDIGKIKFASSNQDEELNAEALSMVSLFSLPFCVCVTKNIGDTFLVLSGGEITVKCAMKGVVESIQTNPSSFLKTITIAHTSGLKTIYSMIDNVSVKVGDAVEKNTILGISLSGEIGFKINYKNKVIKGLEIVDGQLSFI